MRKEKYIYNQNFRGKYESKNPLSKLLISKFFFVIHKICSDIQPENALEVACGHGYSTMKLKKSLNNINLEASDYEERLISDAKKLNPDINFKKESIYKLDRNNDSFSLVFALEVLEHLDNPNLALEELRRVCNNYCIISVPNEPIWRILNILRGSYWNNYGNTPGHINHWNKRTFKKLIGQYFEVQKIYTPLPWIIILAKKV
jgi:ubiquinone/menaquinone biosynthesis C-methylase UbiE